MKNKSIVNLKFPSNQKDATSVEFVNKELLKHKKIISNLMAQQVCLETRNPQLMLILWKMK